MLVHISVGIAHVRIDIGHRRRHGRARQHSPCPPVLDVIPHHVAIGLCVSRRRIEPPQLGETSVERTLQTKLPIGRVHLRKDVVQDRTVEIADSPSVVDLKPVTREPCSLAVERDDRVRVHHRGVRQARESEDERRPEILHQVNIGVGEDQFSLANLDCRNQGGMADDVLKACGVGRAGKVPVGVIFTGCPRDTEYRTARSDLSKGYQVPLRRDDNSVVPRWRCGDDGRSNSGRCRRIIEYAPVAIGRGIPSSPQLSIVQ